MEEDLPDLNACHLYDVRSGYFMDQMEGRAPIVDVEHTMKGSMKNFPYLWFEPREKKQKTQFGTGPVSIRLTNLPPFMHLTEVRKMCSYFGATTECSFMKRVKAEARGFKDCIVSFRTVQEAARACMGLNGKTHKGNTLKAEPTTESAVMLEKFGLQLEKLALKSESGETNLNMPMTPEDKRLLWIQEQQYIAFTHKYGEDAYTLEDLKAFAKGMDRAPYIAGPEFPEPIDADKTGGNEALDAGL